MDVRTGRIFDMEDNHGITQTVVGKDGRTYNVIDGNNCIEHCALVFKRNCLTRAPFGRAQCKDFVPSKRNG